MAGCPGKILIIKPGAIGDLLQITPVIRALQDSFPDARIDIMVGSRVTMALFENNPYVHQILLFDRKGEHRNLGSFVTLWNNVRRAGYDMVINFQRSNLKAWFLAAAAFPCRILVYHKAKGRSVHAVTNHIETLAPLGIRPEIRALELSPGEEAERFAEEYFGANDLNGKTVVALNPGASHPVNRWSTTAFASLADLLGEHPGVKVLLVGGADDLALSTEVVAGAGTPPLVLTGQTDLLQLGAILKRCVILVTGDTGPMHIATAVGTRVLGLFGAADPARTGPVGTGHRVLQADAVACVPCRRRTCASSSYLECMTAITPDKVFDTIKGMLAETEPAYLQ